MSPDRVNDGLCHEEVSRAALGPAASPVQRRHPMSPQRIQMSRQHLWRAEHPDAVIVARPSKWGNPYTITMMQERLDQLAEVGRGQGLQRLGARQMAVAAFKSDLEYGPDSHWWWFGPHVQIIKIKCGLGALAGVDLACWCPLPAPGEPDICHAAVLLELANDGGSR